ncbi:hypothetical protein CON01_01705 [Bacillus thuringiensis]|uniref:DUF4393 domain-containing protein n=1 Tax=Bacillus thuringiensis TaxID=1428 RepID=A0A9X6U4K4_BACTU|nr:DUF4393 domain-containing protein [Bacillus thuringiensis]MCU4771687.1 DUF4393 domain-containing protein [Bacillus cereus]PED15878.1 hypothetical protein CON01_01705 [Bacillus thuringiensis]
MDPIVTAALTSFATTVATNSSKAPLEALDNLWYLALGKFNHFVEKKKADRQHALEEYKKSIAEKVLSIDENNLQEPPMSIVGPALEASKYYIEEESLREMFSNIVAASMDSSKAKTVHHSFVEIIKQLSPEDARNILLFKEAENYPIVKFINDITNGGHAVLRTNVFHGHKSDIIEGDENASSITNLSRLGIVSISYEENFTDKSRYDLYRNSTFFSFLQNAENPHGTIGLIEGIVRITPLGKDFVKVCL